MSNPQDDYPSGGEEPKNPTEVIRKAIGAAKGVIDNYDLDVGAAIVMTIPPGYNSVRYISNIDNEGTASLLRATADQIEQQTNGGNIETP